MKRIIGLTAMLLAGALTIPSAQAQSEKPGVEKLYILNCGEGTAGDISRWSPGINEGKSMDFVDSCYLIKHAQGWFRVGHRHSRCGRGDAGWSPPIPRRCPGRGPRRSPRSLTSSG
jgi:hypothetical protein